MCLNCAMYLSAKSINRPQSARLRSDIEFKLKICLISIDLKRFHGDDLGAIERPDEFIPANAQFTFTGFNLMVLHPARFISLCAINPLAVDRNRGGDITHSS